MKACRFKFLSKKFDDQYTFDLHDYLTRTDFVENMAKINQVVAKSPLPTSASGSFVVAGLYALIVFASLGINQIADVSDHFQAIMLLMAVPGMISISVGYWYIRKLKRSKFEASVVDICERINATENIRGINYRFSRDGFDIADESGGARKPLKHNYVIVIEFDDRFNIPSIQKYGKFPSDDFVSVSLFQQNRMSAVGLPTYSEKKDEEKA